MIGRPLSDSYGCRGTFLEFRNGMINVSPIGRNATWVYMKLPMTKILKPPVHQRIAEREEFEQYDKVGHSEYHVFYFSADASHRKHTCAKPSSKYWRRSSPTTAWHSPSAARSRSTSSLPGGIRLTVSTTSVTRSSKKFTSLVTKLTRQVAYSLAISVCVVNLHL